MKVLHIISGDLWAGAEVQAYTLLTSLQKQAGIQVAAAVMNEGELARRLRNSGIPVTLFPENHLNVFQILSRLRHLISEFQPDIVHTHRIKENILGSIANRLSRNVPSVRTVHGAGEHSAAGLHGLRKQALHNLDLWCGNHLQQRIIAVSSDLAERLGQEFSRELIVVVENGVDVDAVRAEIRQTDIRTREPQAIHIGIAGRLVPVKRVDLFLEAAAILRQSNRGGRCRFHVFGDGPLRDQLIAQAKVLNLTDVTTFHGHRSDIVACIAALDALVLCSDHEGLPMTVLEALVIGTPIVARAIGGVSQVLKDVASATLVHVHTPLAYANALESTLERATRGGADSDVLQAISSETNATRMLSIYGKLCATSPDHRQNIS